MQLLFHNTDVWQLNKAICEVYKISNKFFLDKISYSVPSMIYEWKQSVDNGVTWAIVNTLDNNKVIFILTADKSFSHFPDFLIVKCSEVFKAFPHN